VVDGDKAEAGAGNIKRIMMLRLYHVDDVVVRRQQSVSYEVMCSEYTDVIEVIGPVQRRRKQSRAGGGSFSKKGNLFC
jgi:hypothetical protein